MSFGYFCRRERGFTLVITLMMVVLAAVVVVGLLTSASLDRLNANSYNKSARAEMAAQSAIAAALNALVGANGPTDFRFVTAAGDDGKPALIPLSAPDPTTGSVSLDVAAKRPLYSIGATQATLTLSTVSNPKIKRQVGYVPITINDASGNPHEVERYAFYIDEGGSKQNLSVQGPEQNPTPRPRTYAHDPHELPIVSATAPPVPLTGQQLASINDDRGWLFTPQTANPILSNSPSTPASPLIDDYSYATASAIANIAPDGNARMSLLQLKNYVDALPTDQTATTANKRATLVNQLLTNTQTGAWGKGNLAFLTKLTHYSATQQQQIVANLLSYLSSDAAPITDDFTKPTYFAVEGVADTSGKTKGHPYINFVGAGLIINLDKAGNVTSTQVLGSLGLINPCQVATDSWAKNYSLEFTVEIHGQANGADAAAYFANTQFENLSAVQAPPNPPDSIGANQGFIFPGNPSTLTYTATKTFSPPNQPSNLAFTNVTFLIKTCRLKYIPSDGSPSFYVQSLDNLNTLTMPPASSPLNFTTTGQSNPIRYDFTNTVCGAHLNSDPRLNFQKANWVLAQSTNASPNPPTPATTINVYSSADPSNSDFSGSPPTPTDVTWYTSPNASANFYVKSPAKGNATAPTLDSSGELGFIHTGIPWETIRFYVTGKETNGKQRDRELLAYVHSGTFFGADYSSVPIHIGQAAPVTAIPLVGGPLNVNTNKRPTLQSLLLGASATADSDATARAQGSAPDPDAASLADALGVNADTAPLTLPGDYLALPAAQAVTNSQSTDFNKEILARRTANLVGNQSTRFTVYTLGEARDKASGNVVTTSVVNMRTDVELQVDSNGRPEPKVLRTVYYTTN